MKTLVIISLLFVSFAFMKPTLGDAPIAEYKVGASIVTVWENKNPDGTTWKNFKVEKIYKQGDKWESTNRFDETELLQLRAAIDKAISEEAVKMKE